MLPTKYGKYVTGEIIAESKYPQITAPMARYNGCRGGGNALTVEWSCITKPFVMDAEPEVDNERDQFLLVASTNLEDPNDVQAEIELPLGEKGKKQIITGPTYVYIPKGLKHGFINFKKVKKPIALLSYFLAPEYSTSFRAPDETKYVGNLRTKPGEQPPPLYVEDKIRRVRYPVAKGLRYNIWCEQFGWPGKVSPTYYTQFYRDYVYLEPVHAHRASHQISMYLGGNALDIEDFDAEVVIFMGKEKEKHVIDTCAVDHYVPGIVHLGDEVRMANKPFIHIMWVIGPDMVDYFKAAAKDKVQFSEESKGEVMIREDASDYVPPTKLEDWVWPYPRK